MGVRVVAAAFLLVAMLASCGNEPPAERRDDDGVPVRVRGSLEGSDGGWRLCPASTPPCWDVAASSAAAPEAGEDIVAEGRWLEGNTIRLDGVERSVGAGFPNPCPDAKATSEEDVPADVRAYLDSIPDEFAGTWLARPGPVQVVAVTGHAARHQAALPGVCVTEDGFEHTEAELREAGDEAVARVPAWTAAGWTFAQGYDEVTRNRYVVHFDVVDHRLVDEVERRWGGRVVVEGNVEILEGTVDDVELPTSPPSEITIDTVDRGGMHMAALGTFVLRHDVAGDCLYLEAGLDGRRLKPVWPFGSYAVREPIRVLDARGEILATVDQPFDAGGGLSPQGPAADDPLTSGADQSWVM
jgi:hypothetical protein